ncbi:MAG: hypothetical protein DB853_07785 [Candidatus Brocadia sp.]|nr:MAG: hypothetical protein DB853_07785 [Candidatus Brocadia sp.]
MGFDPYLAYYHSIDYGRASLASDLNPNEGVYLRREALKRYFVEYEGMLNREFIRQETEENTTFQKCFRLQTERLASCIQNTIPYIPFELGI